MKSMLLVMLVLICLCTTPIKAADEPPAPTLADNFVLGNYIAYLYTLGQSTHCIGIFNKAGESEPTGACFLEAREIFVSSPLEVNDKKVYAFTVDLKVRPDAICSILIDTGGAKIVCAEAF